MNTQAQDIFFSVIRSAIWQSSSDFGQDSLALVIPDGYDWTEVIGMFREQALMGLVGPTIMDLPASKKPQVEELCDEVVFTYAGHARMREKIQKTIVAVFDVLEKNGIKAILMKGESMVRFYPEKCQRGIGDIDILVSQSRYRDAVKILQTVSGDMGHEDSMERHYKIKYNGFELEIHQRPIWCANSAHKNDFRRLSQQYVDPEKCERISLRGKEIRVFPMQYNVLFIFNHLLEHLRDGGVGFKQVIDWTVMLANLNNHESHESDEFNLVTLEKELRHSGLFRAWKVMGGIAVMNLGLPKDRMPFYDDSLAEKSQGEILRKLIYGGNFGWKLHLKGNEHRCAPMRVLSNLAFVIKDTHYLWTLFPSGALTSSWGVITNSLRNHFGIHKDNRVFQ